VADIILPPLSLLSAHSRNLESRFLVLRKGQTHKAVYNTIEQAASDGQSTVYFSRVDIYRRYLHGLGTISAKGTGLPDSIDLSVPQLFDSWIVTLFSDPMSEKCCCYHAYQLQCLP
jgi:hypothetical protein